MGAREHTKGLLAPPEPESWERAVLAALFDPVITIDPHGIIRSASESVERVFGWSPSEIVGRNVNILMPEPHRSEHDGYLERYHRGGRAAVLNRAREFDAVHKGGELFTVELCVTRADLPAPEGPIFVAIVHDVSKRRRFEQELRLTQALALDIVKAGDLPKAMHATLRGIISATGWDYGEVWMPEGERCGAGQAILRGACWPDRGKTLSPLRRSGSPGARTLERVTGARRWTPLAGARLTDLSAVPESSFVRPRLASAAGLSTVATIPIRGRSGAAALLVFFLRERRPEEERLLALISAAVLPLGQLVRHKRTEDELARHRHHLSQLISERTTQLEQSHARLRMADRMASLGTLAAGLGHDMDNVLFPVRAHLNAMCSKQGPPGASEGERHLDGIRECITYLQQLADGLQYLAVDPEGNDDATDASTDLHQWWLQTGGLLSKVVPGHVRVEAALAAGLPEVRVAPHLLTQAMLNLLVNAGEAIPRLEAGKNRHGLVRVWAEPGVGDDGSAAVRLGVTDNGVGMSEETRRRAFEMFYTTKPRGMGTGLGLPLVRRVTDRAGGSTEIRSREGQGTTVVMVLPARPALAPDEREPTRVAMVSLDDPRAAAFVRHLLDATGVRVLFEGEPLDADLWVLRPSRATLTRAADWRRRHPAGPLVLFGAPGPRARAAWLALDARIVEDENDLDAVRAALAGAPARA